MFQPQFVDSSRSRRKILRVLTYHPRDDCSVLSEPIPRKRFRRPQANIVHFNPPSTFGTLGDLNALPIELLNEILRYSDLYTNFMFSLLNRQARTIVHASFPYKHLWRHAPRALVALIRTGASHFTVDEVFQTFCSPSCHICGNFGSFLWIPECIRCCFVCLRKAPKLMPMGESRARAVFGLTKKSLAKVPIVTTLPGTYSPFNKYYKMRRHFLSRASALQVATMTHGGKQGLAKHMESKMSHAEATFERRHAPTGTVDHITRFMVTIPFPYFDPISRTTHIGLACKGCKRVFESEKALTLTEEKYDALGDRRDRTYNEMGFFEHLEHCREAQRLWKAHQRIKQNVVIAGSKGK